ncbi:hypothetical protein [Microbacterium sp.]|jgi:type II secretory pathway pseudopilin PulG|uniref:hypothetical protein n=1 Tax=Microbacterium sp. TaxID=51671 RepID=UPI0037C7349A
MPRGIQEEAGFSLVELVIAMFFIAVLALALLPLLTGATQSSTTNRTLVAATSYANAQLAPIRAAFPHDALTTTCTAVAAMGATAVPDPSGSGLAATIAVEPCPVALPDTVMVTVTVFEAASPSKVLVRMPTEIVVSAP